MSDALARLVVRRGPIPNQEFVLTQEKSTIGRAATNDVPITDPEISRRHAQVVRQADGYAVEDLGSTNGTFVNGRRISALTPLQHGDVIDCGEAISLEFFYRPMDEEDTGYHPQPAEMRTVMAPPPFVQPPPVQPAAAPVQPIVPSATPLPTFESPPQELPPSPPSSRNRSLFLGCGCLLLLMFFCVATLFFLDSYQQGQLLYCGPLRPFFQLLLGPLGFSPACS